MLDTSRDSKYRTRDKDDVNLYQSDIYGDVLGGQLRIIRSPVKTMFASASISDDTIIYYATSSSNASSNNTLSSVIDSPFDDRTTQIFT